MNGNVFYIVDVFAERKYAGNQLAVVLDGGRYSGEEMQRIAKEINFSETTFIMNDRPVDGRRFWSFKASWMTGTMKYMSGAAAL